MKRAAIVFAGIALAASPAFSGEGEVRRSARSIPGQYVVVLEPDADPQSVADTARNFRGAKVRHTYRHGVKGFAVNISDADARQLARDARVKFIEEDSVISAASWGLDRIDQRFLPLSGTFDRDGSGAGVTIYIVDTGVFAGHEDFGGRVSPGFTAFSDGIGEADCNGHGTHVAGIAAGNDYGVASSAIVVPVRVLDCTGKGSIGTLLAGLEWILEQHSQVARPSVVNMSLAGHASSALDAAVNTLIGAGLTTVVAAGNEGEDACGMSPARVAAALTVGASTENDQRSSFSNYGACVDLFAPGSNILSASFSSESASALGNGTSAAAPFVAGVAAVVLERYPQASARNVAQTVVSQATSDVLGGLTHGSPNLLLYSRVGSLDESSEGDSQLLGDPGFEYGETFWSSDICTVLNPTGCGGRRLDDNYGYYNEMQALPARSGSNRAAIGGPARSFLLTSETVTIPAAVQRAELSIYLWIVTKNKKRTANDLLTIEIRDAEGKLLEAVGSFSNLDANPTYTQRRFDVSRYRGQTIRVAFTGVQSQGPPTWFLLDDVALKIWK